MSMQVSEPNDPGDKPLFAKVLDAAPTSTQLAGLNAFRGSNTILGGGFDRYGTPLRHFKDMANPRAATRYRSATALHQNQSGIDLLTRRLSYTNDAGVLKPGIIGKGLESSAARGGWIGRRAQSAGVLNGAGKVNNVWEGGLTGRLSAAGRANRMSSIGSKQMGHIYQSIEQMGGDDIMRNMRAAGRGLAQNEVGTAVAASGRGVFSQRIMGFATSHMDMAAHVAEHAAETRPVFMAARKAGIKVATEVAERQAAKAAGKVVARQGAKLLAGRAALAAGALATGPAAPFIEAGLAIWTAFDLAKMGGQLMKMGVDWGSHQAAEGFKSLKGSIDKAPFGTGYVDNEVAATSRARGVMAIQNSRLNARSALGAEAAMMHGHFG